MSTAGNSATTDENTLASKKRDLIELTIPVQPDLLVLVRLTAATVAARADFDMEEIDDLRLAVDELCLAVIAGHSEGRLRICYSNSSEEIEVTCHLEATDQSTPAAAEDDEIQELAARILDALVDEHGRDARGDRPGAWLRKRRSPRGS